MGHHHHDTKNIKTAFFLNMAFAIIEIIGGILTNSVAILADALHDFGDSLSLGAAWLLEKKSHKKGDQSFSYGYRRYAIIGAIINAIILFTGSLFIISETIPRIIHPETADTYGMIWLAILGVIINGIAAFRLSKEHSINQKMVYLHLLEDVLGWVAVLIGAIIMHFYHLPIIDPLLSLGIAGFILFNVFKNLHSVFTIIMQGVPESANAEKIKDFIKNQVDVIDVHDLHIWSMDGQYNVLSVHIVVHGEPTLAATQPLKQTICQHLKGLGINHATLEFELEGEECRPTIS